MFGEFKFHKFTNVLAELGGPTLSKFDVTILSLSKKEIGIADFPYFLSRL